VSPARIEDVSPYIVLLAALDGFGGIDDSTTNHGRTSLVRDRGIERTSVRIVGW